MIITETFPDNILLLKVDSFERFSNRSWNGEQSFEYIAI